MADPLHPCPFCNTLLDPARVDRDRPRCPRCESPLPASLAATLAQQVSTRREPMPTSETPTAIEVPGKKRTVLVVLSIMLTMAVVSALFIWNTVERRRKNDFRPGFIPTNPATVTPTESPLVGLIPARCNIVADVRLADLRQHKFARTVLSDVPPRTISWLAERLRDTVGLTIDDCDDVAIGAEMTDKLPVIFVLLRTRAPYDSQAILKRFEPAKPTAVRKRPAIRFPLATLGEGYVWCLDERLIALMFRVEPGPLEDLETIPVRPRKDLEGSSDRLRRLVRERIPGQSLAWIAGDLTRSAGVIDFLGLVGARTDAVQTLLAAKEFAVGVTADQEWTVQGQLRVESAKELASLEKKLTALDWRGPRSFKVETTPPQAEEAWLLLQIRYGAEAFGRLLGEGVRGDR